MIRFSAKLSSLALLATLAAAPAFAADSSTPAGVASDVQNVQQDNANINKDNAELAKHRADKAADKANDKWGSQAVDSVNIGADKVKKDVHESEKSSDTKTLKEDTNKAANQSSTSNQ